MISVPSPDAAVSKAADFTRWIFPGYCEAVKLSPKMLGGDIPVGAGQSRGHRWQHHWIPNFGKNVPNTMITEMLERGKWGLLRVNPALNQKWEKLRFRPHPDGESVWDRSRIRDTSVVRSDAKKLNKMVYVGRAVEMLFVASSDRAEEQDPKGILEGRGMLYGDNVKDQKFNLVIFGGLLLYSASVEAARAFDVLGIAPGQGRDHWQEGGRTFSITHMDDFEMAAPTNEFPRLRSALREKIKMNDSTPPDRILESYAEFSEATASGREGISAFEPDTWKRGEVTASSFLRLHPGNGMCGHVHKHGESLRRERRGVFGQV